MGLPGAYAVACFGRYWEVFCGGVFAGKRKRPLPVLVEGAGMGSLAVTYFRTREVHYHRRNFVSRSCSGWEGVGPKRYGRQA